MILNKVNYKNLALYGIFKINNNYTVDADNLKVDATVSISYNLSNIQETITSIDEQITELRADEEITFEVKETLIEDYEELVGNFKFY